MPLPASLWQPVHCFRHTSALEVVQASARDSSTALIQQHESALKQLVAEYDAKVHDALVSANTTAERLQTAGNQELAALKAVSAEEVKSLRMEMQKREADLVLGHANQSASLQAAHKETVASMNVDQHAVINDMKHRHAQSQEESQRQLAKAQVWR
jgi:hypothetical protein